MTKPTPPQSISLPLTNAGRLLSWEESDVKVAIIGAGLAGLTLAHGLRNSDVEAEVFERNASAADHPSSYGIHLNADGLRALYACLPAANWAALDESAIAAPDVVRFRDRRLRPLLTVDLAASTQRDPVTHRRAVGRDDLHAALLIGLGGAVRWGREFVGYERLGRGLQVHFADGSHVNADVVVGADGANSRVRAQRLPQLRRIDLGILNVAGRTPLTRSLIKSLPPNLVDGSINNVVPTGAGWMFISHVGHQRARAGIRSSCTPAGVGVGRRGQQLSGRRPGLGRDPVAPLGRCAGPTVGPRVAGGNRRQRSGVGHAGGIEVDAPTAFVDTE